MKVLMFGWEFPPHISGGLGTACFGMTRGLSTIDDVEIIFVVPKMYGNEYKNNIRLIAADDIPVSNARDFVEKIKESLEYIEVESQIIPYIDPEEFRKRSISSEEKLKSSLKTDSEDKLHFTGNYGANLFTEIYNYALAADRIATAHQFDVIHAHDWLTYPAGIAAKKASGKPLVIHVHATDFDRSGGNANQSVFAIERKGMLNADKIITVSNMTRKTVIEKYGIPSSKIVTIYNAVEPLQHTKEHKYTKGTDDKIVTFLGRITMQKGPEYFLSAAKLVLQKMERVRFVMAGSGDLMSKMVQRAAELGIADKFHFTGFLRGDRVFELLHLSDVYVMPSVSEPFGITPLEAMQSNVPVIISYQSGVSELLTHAIKVDFWDVEALSDAIHGILKYPALSKMLVNHGKREAAGFKWEDAAHKIHAVYKSALIA